MGVGSLGVNGQNAQQSYSNTENVHTHNVIKSESDVVNKQAQMSGSCAGKQGGVRQTKNTKRSDKVCDSTLANRLTQCKQV